MINYSKEIGKRLFAIRNEKGLTLKAVADQIGVNCATYFHYEQGDRRISRKKLAKLCKFYGVDEEYFIDFAEVEEALKAVVEVEVEEKDYLTLQAAVDALEGDPVIHIGSQTGFFFVGTKEEYEANIDFVQQDLLATRMEALETNRRKAELYMRKIAEPDDEYHGVKYWDLLSDRAKKLSKVCSYIPKLEEYLDTFVAIRKREVVEQYDRIQNDGVVIIVKGKEFGGVYDYEEYKAGIAEEDMEGED